MSSPHQRITSVMRLAAIAATTASLKAQFSELERLREEVEKPSCRRRHMSAEIQFDPEIQWDGSSLSVWAVNNGDRILCRIPRATIHGVPPFSDVLGREIARDRLEIFYRLRAGVVC